jgi:hypothetical protein
VTPTVLKIFVVFLITSVIDRAPLNREIDKWGMFVSDVAVLSQARASLGCIFWQWGCPGDQRRIYSCGGPQQKQEIQVMEISFVITSYDN